ncbi:MULTISPECIES: hypothetical protein [unclassified Aureimonas]|uniref:hypothetical protein n=1 Tax=unclassified Aureimonas TaxID=2615206 RepID=UPI0006F6B00E|nr:MULTISPECIES: hypothetical protein [unclassified Aureimonas]KQT69615.1 hypothetical protein ASG62_00275 [Aureimonas sp. Leaf427]KQT80966.1 hypothetical protein ASG54_05805 [Aureimonas sp. Leaf460]
MIATAHELSDPGEEAAIETDHAASPFHGSKTGGMLRNQSPLRNLPWLESRANGSPAFLGELRTLEQTALTRAIRQLE